MGLNVAKGNMYEWITHTWNTIKGECPHGCSYCYMHRWGKQRPVRFDRNELKEFDRDIEKYGEGLFIFVGSSCDMWSSNIRAEWIVNTLNQCKKYSNSYLFQTKNPELLMLCQGLLPRRSSVCVTIETNRFLPSYMGTTVHPENRVDFFSKIHRKRYVTIEPIIDFDLRAMIELVRRCSPEQVNIGADSCSNHLPEPSADKVLALIDALQSFTTIARKSNLERITGIKP